MAITLSCIRELLKGNEISFTLWLKHITQPAMNVPNRSCSNELRSFINLSSFRRGILVLFNSDSSMIFNLASTLFCQCGPKPVSPDSFLPSFLPYQYLFVLFGKPHIILIAKHIIWAFYFIKEWHEIHATSLSCQPIIYTYYMGAVSIFLDNIQSIVFRPVILNIKCPLLIVLLQDTFYLLCQIFSPL